MIFISYPIVPKYPTISLYILIDIACLSGATPGETTDVVSWADHTMSEVEHNKCLKLSTSASINGLV